MRKFPQTLEPKERQHSIQSAAEFLFSRGYRYQGVTIKGQIGVSFDRYVFGKKGKPTVYLSELDIAVKGKEFAHSYALNPHGLEPKGLDTYLN